MQRLAVMQEEVPAFRVDVRRQRRMVVIAPVGDVDLATVPELDRSVQELRDAAFEELRLDLRGATFFDSTALRFVLRLRAAAAADGVSFSVLPGPPAVQRVFALTGLEHLVPFVSWRDA